MVAQLRTVGAVICAAGSRPGADRSQALRAARRDRHGRVDPAHRQLDHVEEARRGHLRARARREGRLGRVHEGRRRRPGALAETMVRLGDGRGRAAPRPCSPRMDTPLGRACGNALEVTESVEVLAGRRTARRRRADGHAGPGDAGAGRPARRRPRRGAGGGRRPARVGGHGGGAGRRPRRAAARQHGHVRVVRAAASGYVTRLDALAVGLAAWRLGAGRARKEHPVSPSAGVVCLAKEGDAVEEGQPVLRAAPRRPRPPRRRLGGAATARSRSARAAAARPLVIDILRP